MAKIIFNKCNCLNFKNDNLSNLNGYKQKIIIGSFLPLCNNCLKKESINIKYKLIVDKYCISLDDINELISMIRFMIRNKHMHTIKLHNFNNDILEKWIQSINGNETKNILLKNIAIKIDNSLCKIWNLANKKNQLPCNINIVILNPITKKELYNSYWSYQYCEMYF